MTSAIFRSTSAALGRQRLDLVFHEFEALARDVRTRIDVRIDEVVRDPLRDGRGDSRIFVLEDDSERIELHVPAPLALLGSDRTGTTLM